MVAALVVINEFCAEVRHCLALVYKMRAIASYGLRNVKDCIQVSTCRHICGCRSHNGRVAGRTRGS
jgi:hypothetical protein